MNNSNYPSKLSVVIPLFNEEKRFSNSFKICANLHKRFPGWELIFVNDGSNDQTQNLVKEKIGSFKNMILISYSQNQGKGYALKKGILKASKPLVLFTDIDFSTPINQLELFYPFIQKGADIVIGTRKVKGAQITQHQPKLREYLGRSFTNLTNLILNLQISDYTCGFKLFKKDVAQKLFHLQKIKRWSFDAEILYLASRNNYKIFEVPVVWQNDASTKVNLVRDITNSFVDLLKIKFTKNL